MAKASAKSTRKKKSSRKATRKKTAPARKRLTPRKEKRGLEAAKGCFQLKAEL